MCEGHGPAVLNFWLGLPPQRLPGEPWDWKFLGSSKDIQHPGSLVASDRQGTNAQTDESRAANVGSCHPLTQPLMLTVHRKYHASHIWNFVFWFYIKK